VGTNNAEKTTKEDGKFLSIKNLFLYTSYKQQKFYSCFKLKPKLKKMYLSFLEYSDNHLYPNYLFKESLARNEDKHKCSPKVCHYFKQILKWFLIFLKLIKYINTLF